MELDAIQLIEPIVGMVIIVFLLIYLAFSLVVIRQVQLLNRTLLTGISPFFKFFSYLHALVALALVIFAILRI